MIRAIIRVIIDAQAWLYANQLKLQARVESPGTVVTEEDFERWQDEWKRETAKLIEAQGDLTTSDDAR